MASAALLAGCVATEPLNFRVTPLGQEPAKVKDQYVYALPQTVLKVEVTLREVRSVPGPYWEYAEKYLGLKEVVKAKSSRWNIWDVAIGQHQELDPLKGQCNKCHHATRPGQQPAACGSCHKHKKKKDPETGASGFKKAFHKLCGACHLKDKPTPKKCKVCHSRKK